MAMTLSELSVLLDEIEIKHERKEESILTGFATRKYRDPKGREGVSLVIKLDEDGEYFSVFAPKAFVATGPHVEAFLRACMVLQWRTKLVQFEFDPEDGEIRPIVEFPVEDGKITAKQLDRCVRGLVRLLNDSYEALEKTLETGVFEMPGEPDADTIRAMMEQLRLMLERTEGRRTPPSPTAPTGI